MYHHQTHRNRKTLDDAVGHERRYKILCANAVREPCEPQKATQIILETINLESDQYRMGHTKVSDTYCGPRRDSSITTRKCCRKFVTGNTKDLENVRRIHKTSTGCPADVSRTFALSDSYNADDLFANIKI